ncbi:MAG: LytR/AlgR family response regulator transcription factor [Lachnospiraceae bacterium]
MILAICDDQPDELKKYSSLLHRFAEKQNIDMQLLQYTTGGELLNSFSTISPKIDAIFLDINMPEIDGMRVALKLRELKYSGEIVFLTVSKTHVFKAFDVNAFHYILKDVTTLSEFEQIFKRVIDLIREKQGEYILFTAAGEHRNVEISTIYYFDIYQKIITVHFNDEEFEFYCISLGKVETQLLDRGFVRIHRAYLVALKKIKAVSYNSVILTNGKELPVGRKYIQELRQKMEERNNVRITTG